MEKGVWNESEGGLLDPRSKPNEIKSIVTTNEAVVYYPLIDWKTKKNDLITSGTCVTPLNDCIQKSSIKIQSWVKSKWSSIQWVSEKKHQLLSLKRCNKLDHPWWLTIQSLWGMGQLWKIITRWMIQWESIERKNINEHSAGVAPPCRPPPAGCSKFPSYTVYLSTAPTGFMEGGHVT